MNTFWIKTIAIITMFIDHIGLFFFPQSFLLRTIGRIAFPLFSWLIANGAIHTKNIKKYFIRLLVFAVISQIPFMLAIHFVDPSSTSLNVFFTLSIGLGAIILIQKTKKKILWFVITLVCAVLASVLNTDYGGFGVLSIVAFYLFYERRKTMIIAQAWIYIFLSINFILQRNTLGLIQTAGLISLIPIGLYNGKEGRKLQYLFYFIYPLHYLLIYLLLQLHLLDPQF